MIDKINQSESTKEEGMNDLTKQIMVNLILYH